MCVTFQNLGAFGRLGNQLFQIAATIGIAIENDDIAIFPKWKCNYTKKEMSPFFKNPINENLPLNFLAETYQEPFFHYKKVSYKDNLILHDSYFQSEKYFKHCEELIRWHFEPNDKLLEDILKEYGELLKKETCSIHVRRGDYAGNSYHDVCNIEYYTRAVEFIKKERKIEKFLIFSDDIKWCRKNLPSDFIFIENNLTADGIDSIYRINDTDVKELFLMSLCKHNIITNSSFSWWASWLNKNPKKIIIAPLRWFGSANLDSRDLYTKEMVKI